jgi:hypothetical protein
MEGVVPRYFRPAKTTETLKRSPPTYVALRMAVPMALSSAVTFQRPCAGALGELAKVIDIHQKV